MNLIRIILRSVGIFVFHASTIAHAGNYGVSPLDVQFSPQQKSAVLNVTSEDRETVSLRLRAMRWTQNDRGEDVYEEANDLIFFPKRLDLKPGEKKIVRVGVNEIPQSGERAYRLFLEELAPPTTPGDGQTRLSVLVNIGVPVFISSASTKQTLVINQAVVDSKGELRLNVTNPGTSRIRLSRIITADGALVSESIPGRYVFPGVSKTYNIPVPREMCKSGAARLRIQAENENADTDVNFPAGC